MAPLPTPSTSDLSRPLRVSDNGRFLIEPNGQPFFWLADTGWAIFARLTREECDDYLRDRSEKDFNVVQAVAIGGPFDLLDAPNRYGDLALIDMDFERPNPRYFEHIDWVVACAARHGIRMAILPAWGASLIGGQQVEGATFTPGQARWYGRWIAQRYRGQGVIWVLGGDTNPLWPSPDQGATWVMGGAEKPDASPTAPTRPPISLTDHRPAYDAMAQGIIEGDGDDPFITFHPNPTSFPGAARPRTSLYFSDRPWLKMNMLQSSHYAAPASEIFPTLRTDFTMLGPYNYVYVREEYDSRPVRPVLDGEPRYEGIPVDIAYNPAKPLWDAYHARNGAYHAVFAGACGHTFGNLSVHLSYNPDIHPPIPWYPGDIAKYWRDELNTLGAQHMRHLRALMLSRPYFSRVPDQTLLMGPTGEGAAHVSATKDEAGRYVMIYAPEGAPITIDMTKIAGRAARVSWFDPRTGSISTQEDLAPTEGMLCFNAPTRGDNQDWVLLLDSIEADFADPAGDQSAGNEP